MSLTPGSLAFTRATNRATSPPSAWIASSISSTDWLAPPCSGPNRALTPALMLTKRFALLDPTIRTVDVEQFCSWSACSRNSRFRALDATGLTTYSSAGTPKVMRRKLSTYPRSLFG